MATPKHLQRPTPQYEFEIALEPLPDEKLELQSKPNAPYKHQIAQREQVLIDPKNIDDTLPIAKAIAAALGWFNSIVTTMFSTADLQNYITGQPPTWIAWAAGFLLAAILTFGQVYTSRRNRIAYAIFLFPDALMTSVQWGKWLLLPLFLKLIPIWWLAVVTAAVIGGIIGIVSARTPERLTFGKRV